MTEIQEGSKVARASGWLWLARLRSLLPYRASDVLEASASTGLALGPQRWCWSPAWTFYEAVAERDDAMKRVAKRASDRADKAEAELREAKWGDRYAIVEAIKLLEASHLTRALNVLRNATSSEDATRPTGDKE